MSSKYAGEHSSSTRGDLNVVYVNKNLVVKFKRLFGWRVKEPNLFSKGVYYDII